MSNQVVISKFGESKEAYSIDILKWLIREVNSLDDITKANILIRPITKTFFKQSNSEQLLTKTEFNIAKWFIYDNSSTYVATCDPAKQRIYKIQADIYQAIKIIFTHIRDVWCSGDWNVTEYIIKWFAGMSIGRKMYSILYLKSGQSWDKGKVLLLLEEMPTEKSQWNSLYRALKDKVTSDTIEIHEKYKTPTQYKNFMSTIILTNENALRVENDNRRTVFLDISPAQKRDLQYFKQLGDAMKYPGVGETFYAYLKVIADKYPDFNGNPPPMTAFKQEHIVSTLLPLFQFIKETYIVNADYTTTCLPVHILYATYTSYCISRNIIPLSKVVVARSLSSELNMTSNVVKINGKCTRVYNLSRKTLYKKYFSNNWIHETDEIDIEEFDIPKKTISDPKALDQFLAQIGVDISNKQKKKLNTLIPPLAKPEYKPEIEQEPEQESEVEQEPEIEPEPYRIPDPMPKINTAKYWEWIDRHKYDYIKPWYNNSHDKMIDELYSIVNEC
ncbi:hypothetical protein RclHR1_34350001 [Rhizophagus clarus]|uniref:NrS-1 polymerase-like helicase domain-containing protein n=1 Tax=Rhizophagus clarus TaxID=94130 RepID=A0A2Z6RAL9_9GLOM|nr:hypothetical protein RclHR1_34350001 [Rhizophagus clarus]